MENFYFRPGSGSGWGIAQARGGFFDRSFLVGEIRAGVRFKVWCRKAKETKSALRSVRRGRDKGAGTYFRPDMFADSPEAGLGNMVRGNFVPDPEKKTVPWLIADAVPSTGKRFHEVAHDASGLEPAMSRSLRRSDLCKFFPRSVQFRSVLLLRAYGEAWPRQHPRCPPTATRFAVAGAREYWWE